jgi:O-methyltransferase involved in polyketide biosynthesis
VFIANGGVFEYFLQEEVEAFLGIVARQLAPAAVVLSETIGSNHDLSTENESMVYGREMAFSHNDPYLLRNAGFKTLHQSEREGYPVDGGGRWIRLLATID